MHCWVRLLTSLPQFLVCKVLYQLQLTWWENLTLSSIRSSLSLIGSCQSRSYHWVLIILGFSFVSWTTDQMQPIPFYTPTPVKLNLTVKFSFNILFPDYLSLWNAFFQVKNFLKSGKNRRKEAILRELRSRGNCSKGTRALLYSPKQRIKVPVYLC